MALLSSHQGLKIEIHCTLIAVFFFWVFEVCGYIHHFQVDLRACLHGVGNPGLVGLVSFVFTLWGTQNKRNLPTRAGSPTPCKQGLKCILFTPTILYKHCYQFLLGITAVPREIEDNGYAKFWWQTRCIMVYGKIVNCIICVYYSTTLVRDFR